MPVLAQTFVDPYLRVLARAVDPCSSSLLPDLGTSERFVTSVVDSFGSVATMNSSEQFPMVMVGKLAGYRTVAELPAVESPGVESPAGDLTSASRCWVA